MACAAPAPETQRALRERYDRTLDANRTRSGTGFAPVGLVPGDLFGDAPEWIRLSLRPREPAGSSRAISAMHGGGLDMPLCWLREPGHSPVRTSALDPSRLSIGCELALARIDRSAWFDSALLASRRWWWRAAGTLFSDGAPPPDTTGEWQMTPTELALVRNLIVDTGGPDTAAAELALRMRSATAAGCWIFGLQSPDMPLAQRREVMISDGSRLAAPNVQIAAVVCQLMPKQPDPDPGLLQPTTPQ